MFGKAQHTQEPWFKLASAMLGYLLTTVSWAEPHHPPRVIMNTDKKAQGLGQRWHITGAEFMAVLVTAKAPPQT